MASNHQQSNWHAQIMEVMLNLPTKTDEDINRDDDFIL